MKGSPTAAAARPPYDAVIFDLDGVVTRTATVHQLAWRDAYDAIVRDPRFPKLKPAQPFTSKDYLSLVDGKPREVGLMNLLASRGVVVDLGAPTDATGDWTAYGLGALKNKAYLARLKKDGVQAYPERWNCWTACRRPGFQREWSLRAAMPHLYLRQRE